jgi:hypothetical protein
MKQQFANLAGCIFPEIPGLEDHGKTKCRTRGSFKQIKKALAR